MSRTVRAFAPLENKTITWAAASNSQSVQFTTTVNTFGGATSALGTSTYFPNTLVVNNATAVAVFVKSQAGSAPTAATTDFEVPAGQSYSIDVGQNDYVAVIPSASATGSVYLSRGLGN